MKKFRHPRRSVFLFFLLGILTIGIYPLVVFTQMGIESNRIIEGREGYRRSMNFIGAFFLGFITLGIVPLVWFCRLSGKIGRLARAEGIKKPSTSGPSFFFLCVFFGALVITSIIGLCKLFHTLNKLEQKLNADMDAKAALAAQEEILPIAEAPAQEEAPQEPVPEAQETATPETPEEQEGEEAVEQPQEEEAPAPFEYVTENEPVPPAPDAPRSDIAAIYHVAARQETRKWRVRVGGSNEPAKLFDSREEALAYAKGLAAKKRVSLRVKK